MKRKSKIQSVFVAWFVLLSVLLLAANSVSAQCGNYFRAKNSGNAMIFPGTFSIGGALLLDDWTGDGKPDLWNYHGRLSTATVDLLIYPSKPDGYWDWNNPIIYTTTLSNFNTPYRVADFDADGRTDVAIGRGSFQLLHNNGDGTMTTLPTVSDPSAFTIGFADLNNDNLLDWVYYVAMGTGTNRVFDLKYRLQTAGGAFASPTTVITGSSANGFIYSTVEVGDFNGDDKVDILYSTDLGSNTNQYVLVKNLGNASFQALPPVVTDLYVPVLTPTSVRDFNNDGRDDILSRNVIFYGRADGTFDRAPLSGIGGTTTPAELNGDNNLDVIEFGSTSYAAHISDGAGNFTRTVYRKNFNSPPPRQKIEDYTGDGKADIYDASVNEQVYLNVFREHVIKIRENVCQSYGETNFADFDGNFGADITTWNPASGNWSSKNARWYPLPDPNTTTFNWGLGVHGDVPAPGDYDGDGKTDYAVYRNSTGAWYILKSSDSSWLVFPFGLPGDIAVPNDYDGGGKTDLAVWRPSDGIWYIWFSETQSFGALHFGATGDKPVPADFDGDRKTDMAVYRPSEGNWYYLRSSDLTYVVLHWGNATDIPLPADYDGDGRADVTIYRDGFWWIWRSMNNQYGVIQFGQSGDVPMPIYRNSMSADITVYRPSTRLWYNFDSSAWGAITVGGSGDVPVRFGLPNN